MPRRRVLGALIIAALLTPRHAWAYVDPGAGSMLLQVLLGGAAGLVMAVKLLYRRITARPEVEGRTDSEPPPRADPGP